MIALDLITNEIPPLKPTEEFAKALDWMDEFKVRHLPVVKGNEYLGLLADSDVLDMEDPFMAIDERKFQLAQPFVREHQHVYDVMKVVSELHLSVVPILDADNHYLGCTTLPYLMELVTNSSSISEPGGIIVLELNSRDYSLAQIAQIVESNDAKILSSYITSAPDSTMMEVTLKINKKNLGGILQTLNRYDYIVSASYTEDRFKEDVKDRYDSLMKYLNI